MLAVPAATPTVTPWFGEVVATVAAAVLSELHELLVLMVCVVELLNVPTALKTIRPPVGILWPLGVTAIETMVALVTVKGTEVVSDPRVAVTLACPAASPFPSPLEEPMVSAAVLSDDQVTTWLRSWVLPQL